MMARGLQSRTGAQVTGAASRMRLTREEGAAFLADLAAGRRRAKKSKFQVSAKHLRTADDRVFDSRGEMLRYLALKQRQDIGDIRDLKLQPAYPVWLNGIKVCTVTLDFSYTIAATGELVVEDKKSSGTAKDKLFSLHKRLVEAHYGIKVTVVI